MRHDSSLSLKDHSRLRKGILGTSLVMTLMTIGVLSASARDSEVLLHFDHAPVLDGADESIHIIYPNDGVFQGVLAYSTLDPSLAPLSSWIASASLQFIGDARTIRYPVTLYMAGKQIFLCVGAFDGFGKLVTSSIEQVSFSSPHSSGLWLSTRELERRPTSGISWQELLEVATEPNDSPDVSDGYSNANVQVLAKALAYARTGSDNFRNDVILACSQVIGTEGGRSLDLGRELLAYIISADLVDLPEGLDRSFRSWLDVVRTRDLAGYTLISTHEVRPNNWGTHCGASRLAAAAYLGDHAEVRRCAELFKSWVGEGSRRDDFDFGSDLSWHQDPQEPRGINARGATKDGHSIDGVLPDDQRRAGSFQWPPPPENYVYEALQGALAQALILDRFGYKVWEWGDRALLRAFTWLYEQGDFPASGDDSWQPSVINYVYGTQFQPSDPPRPGKNMGWTDWTHGDHSLKR